LNWIISNYYNNTEYKNVKCGYCGTEIILNPNIKSRGDQVQPVNLDHSLHNCYYKLNQKRNSRL
jgi:hypothetical protein